MSRYNFNYFTLTGPNRLVIDLKGASNATNLARIENKSELVRKIRESTPLEKGSLRLVLDLDSAIKPVVFPLAPAGPYGHRLVIDLPYEEKGSAAAQPAPVGGHGKAIVIEKKGFFAFREKGLLKAVRGDSCKYFSTVLGPGSDRFHKDHFHFDLRARKSGYRHCSL